MRRPEEIQADIDVLSEELRRSGIFYSWELFYTDEDAYSDTEKIGFCYIGRAKKLLTALHEGKILRLVHGVFGSVELYMNQQRNRIVVGSSSYFHENNIMDFIVMHPGTWYVWKGEVA